jgi:ligand-binding SRPBCC domain-containing protein
MKLRITTDVKASLPSVKAGFTQDLFLSLNPPFPPVKLRQFDGCKKGDRVELELNFIFFKQRWVSDITDDEETEDRWFFIDEGTTLPFFLKSWRHHHSVEKRSAGSAIIDDITFSTGTLLTDLLMYPALLGQFLYRKPVYKRIFM